MKLADDTMGANWICVSVFIFLVSPFLSAYGNPLLTAGSQYRGKYIGRLTQRKHGVSGEVFAVDARTLHIRHFTYDGLGPDAFFWTGFNPEGPNPNGIIVPDERGTKEVLKGYNGQDVTISLPDGLTLRDIKWFGVWCRAYEVNFADIFIPANLDFPQPHVIGSLTVSQYGVSSGPIVVVDAQTILVPDFTYDGQAPDLHFWVGRGKPGPDGIRVHDETGGDAPLVKADKKTMVLSLPGDITIFDIDYFGVWCRLYGIDFGHVRVPLNLNVPPSLRMLGVTPQTKVNCEVLHDDSALEIRWAVVGSGETIVFQMVGRIDSNNYMAFGLSGESDRSVMVGSDATIGWLDETSGRGYVVDYFLDGKYPCNGKRGVCPDAKLQAGGAGLNNVRLLSAAVINGFTILTWQRRLSANDDSDKSILTNGTQAVVWAVGPLNNQEAAYHSLRNKDDIFIDFGRVPKWNCPAPEPETPISPSASNLSSASSSSPVATAATPTKTTESTGGLHHTNLSHLNGGASSAIDMTSSATQQIAYNYKNFSSSWNVPPILCHEPEDGVFYAQIGPTGGKRGFNVTTGQPNHAANAWYINGLLLPEIYVVRHKAYTFVVEGGDNPDIPSKYHPFYITDDLEGGFHYKSQLQKKAVKVFAGVRYDERGNSMPTSTGRLCLWVENDKQPADFFSSYGAYQRSLSLTCDEGHSGVLQFVPDESTPNLVYYQSYTAKNLGWKIHVVDKCEKEAIETKGLATEKSTTAQSVNQRDQSVAESIQQATNLSFPTTNGIKELVKEDQSVVGSVHGTVDYLLVKEKQSTFTAAEKEASDSSSATGIASAPHLTAKQEISQLVIHQPAMAAQASQTVQGLRQQEMQLSHQPETIPLAHNSFHQVPLDLVAASRIPQQVYAPSPPAATAPAAPSYIPVQTAGPPIGAPPTTVKLQRNPMYTILDAYGRRVGETSDPAVIYDNRPAEYSLVAPRPSHQHISQQQIVYDHVPQATVYYASTSAPPPQHQQQQNHPFHFDNRHKIEYTSILSRIPAAEITPMAHRQGSHLIAIQNGPTGGRRTAGALGQQSEPLSLSSENVRYIEYPPIHLRVPQTAVNWARSRNLPKRENLLPPPEQLRREALFVSRDTLRTHLKRSGSFAGRDAPIRNDNLLNAFRHKEQQQASRATAPDFPADRNVSRRHPSSSALQSGHHQSPESKTTRKSTPGQVYPDVEHQKQNQQRQNRSSETTTRTPTEDRNNGTDQGNSALSLTLLTDIWQTINQGNKEPLYQYHQHHQQQQQRFPASASPLPRRYVNLNSQQQPPAKQRSPIPINVNRQQFLPFRHQRTLSLPEPHNGNNANAAEQEIEKGLPRETSNNNNGENIELTDDVNKLTPAAEQRSQER